MKKILDSNNILHHSECINNFNTHNCIVYNEYDDDYYIYIRHNKPDHQSFVQLIKTKDFENFTPSKDINIYDNKNMVLITPGIFKYNNINYYISIPTTIDNKCSKNNSTCSG